MATLSGYGFSIDLPAGWSGRLFKPPTSGLVAHVATFPEIDPANDGPFGSGATAHVGAGDLFASLVEYIPDAALVPGAGLYAARSIPSGLTAAHFSPVTLQIDRAGQAGLQEFFTVGQRPFVLYVVAGLPLTRSMVGEIAAALQSLRIDPAYQPAFANVP